MYHEHGPPIWQQILLILFKVHFMDLTTLHTLLKRQQPGYSLDQAFYVQEDIFRFEWEHIWKKYWLFAGTTADIPRPGDYFLYQAGQDSIIIIRDKQGVIHAHYNTCRHRGSLICSAERGQVPKLMCPYHAWVYELDGRLIKARLMPEDFDRQAHSLHPAQLAIVEGFIFVSFADHPPAMDQLKEDFAPYLKPFAIDQAKVAHRASYTIRSNWKLVGENFRECYHCGPAHPEYCSAVIGASLVESTAEVLAERQAAWKTKGLPIDTVPFTADSFHFAIRYPLRPGIKSYSVDGQAVCLPMGLHTDHDAGVLGMVVYPNFWMDAVSDYLWTMRLTPISAKETRIELAWLVDKDAVEGLDYEVERLTNFWRITGEQDWKLCEDNFKGIESSRYRPGPYAPAEADVAEYVAWYLRRMNEGLQKSLPMTGTN